MKIRDVTNIVEAHVYEDARQHGGERRECLAVFLYFEDFKAARAEAWNDLISYMAIRENPHVFTCCGVAVSWSPLITAPGKFILGHSLDCWM